MKKVYVIQLMLYLSPFLLLQAVDLGKRKGKFRLASKLRKGGGGATSKKDREKLESPNGE